MHSYLRAIGYSDIKNRKQLELILKQMIREKDNEKIILKDGIRYSEINTEVLPGAGVVLRGEYDEDNVFYMEQYCPYHVSSQNSLECEVSFHKKVDTESYAGMCDDNRIGVSMIFSLINVVDYIKHREEKTLITMNKQVALSALSIEGKVLLGFDYLNNRKSSKLYNTKRRNQLIAEAKEGSQEAIESLTLDELDLYSSISKRSRKTDVYTIVESTFIPYGSESDLYTLIGNIVHVNRVENTFTNEKIYQILVLCNDVPIDICINEKDIEGEPAPGRRFKGTVWMQGIVQF